MDAVAYIDAAVINFVNDNLVPIRLKSADPILAPKFNIKWTPSLLLLDARGTEHYRTLGFYPPQDLIPSLLLGMGKAKFDQADRPAACGHFEKVLSDFPKSIFAPEALYLNGISRYIETHDVQHLTGMYDRLAAEYASSPWLTRADPYKFLKG